MKKMSVGEILKEAFLEQLFPYTCPFCHKVVSFRELYCASCAQAVSYTHLIDSHKLGDNFRFVKENMEVKVLSYKGNVFGVEPPNFVELEVTQTDPGFKGDTATNATKPATLETGADVYKRQA